jgi:tetratricopeptide (TPR) repeat protein
MGLGVAARGLGDFKLARAEYKKASEIDPQRTDYIFNLGLLAMDYENDGTPAGYAKAQAIFEKFIKHATPAHQKDPDGKGPELSWVEKAKKRVEACKKAIHDIKQAEKEMAELKKLQAQQAKEARELAEKQKRAEELAAKEAAGKTAPDEDSTGAANAAGAESKDAVPAKDSAAAKTGAKSDGAAKKDDGKKTTDGKKATDGKKPAAGKGGKSK